MKIITLYQPWASFITLGWKTIETREHNRFASLVNQTIGIHAGLKFDANWKESVKPYMDISDESIERIKKLKGIILCTAFVIGTRPLQAKDSEHALIDCSAGNRFGLFLKNIKPIVPIKVKGRRGIWTYNLDFINSKYLANNQTMKLKIFNN
jgi:hypothetical protein